MNYEEPQPASARAASASAEPAPAAASASPRSAAGGRAAVADRSPVVIYIAGSGRSGSTLLERTLGGIPGFVNVGELIDLFRRTVSRGERCGCGQPFADCPFWGRVGQSMSGGWDRDSLEAVRRLQLRVARQRRMPRLLGVPLAGSQFRADLASYGTAYVRLYQAVAAVSGAHCVVDASKWPVQALALARAGIDVRVVHLVRDVRGVAHSLSNRQITRPHAADGTDLMSHSRPAGAAARWVACQSQAGLLRHCGLPVTRVRYEDFVRQPRCVVEAALSALGLPVTREQLTHIGSGEVHLGPSHGLSGNPTRFRDGQIRLLVDNEWRDRMARHDRIAVTVIGLPWLLRYRRGAIPGTFGPDGTHERGAAG